MNTENAEIVTETENESAPKAETKDTKAPTKRRPKSDNITVTEVTRNTSAGRFSYSIYEGKVARRAFRRGRPSYEMVAGITLGAGDKPTSREISAESQLGRLLVG